MTRSLPTALFFLCCCVAACSTPGEGWKPPAPDPVDATPRDSEPAPPEDTSQETKTPADEERFLAEAAEYEYHDLHCHERADGEVCDGWDNDCDGLVDERVDSCHCGDLGAPCAGGFECVEGHCLSPDRSEVYIPGGTFWMGCNPSRDPCCNGEPETWCGWTFREDAAESEWPYHPVHVPPFVIDRTPVTATAYQACVEAGDCTVPKNTTAPNATYGKLKTYKHPINYIDWYQARTYCEVHGMRLCTEAEWEKAARGGCRVYCEPGDPACCKEAMPTFPWGEEAQTCAHHPYSVAVFMCTLDCARNSDADSLECWPDLWPTAAVDAYPEGVSAYGVLALSENGIEWLEDCGPYEPQTRGGHQLRVVRGYQEAPRDGTASYTSNCDYRALRPAILGRTAGRTSHPAHEIEENYRTGLGSARCCRSLRRLSNRRD